MGGAIAAEVAITRPTRVRGLVLIGSAGVGVREPLLLRLAHWPLVGELVAALVNRSTVARQLRAAHADPAQVSEAEVDQYYAPLRQRGAGRAMLRTLRRFRFDSLSGHLRHIPVPTLLLWGSDDSWIPVEFGRRMSLELPASALIVIPRAGHNAMEERPEDVNAALLAYLQHGLPRPPADLAMGSH
jgi:pimeloyl-ACP methyl ester carboxylesterase